LTNKLNSYDKTLFATESIIVSKSAILMLFEPVAHVFVLFVVAVAVFFFSTPIKLIKSEVVSSFKLLTISDFVV